MVATTLQNLGTGLDEPTLILNKGWQPIDACTAREALTDVVAEKARILCPDSYNLFSIEEWMEYPIPEDAHVIRTVRSQIRVPEIVVNEYNFLPQKKVVFSRRNLWRRDCYRCQYCGKRPASDEITVDHVLPRSQGGLTTFENTVLACVSCNKKKDNRTPEQAGMPLFRYVKKGEIWEKQFYRRPKTPRWNPAFAVRRQKLPKSWNKFLQFMIDELYWNTELEP